MRELALGREERVRRARHGDQTCAAACRPGNRQGQLSRDFTQFGAGVADRRSYRIEALLHRVGSRQRQAGL